MVLNGPLGKPDFMLFASLRILSFIWMLNVPKLSKESKKVIYPMD